LNHIRVLHDDTANGTSITPAPPAYGFIDSVNDEWILEGTYASGQTRVQKQLEFNEAMFVLGKAYTDAEFTGATAVATVYTTYDAGTYTADGINVDATNHEAYDATYAATLPGGDYPVGYVFRDWAVPIWYRGVPLEDDEAVIVDIIWDP